MSTKKKPAAKSGGQSHNRPGEKAGQFTQQTGGQGAGAAVAAAYEAYLFDEAEAATIEALISRRESANLALERFMSQIHQTRNLPMERGMWRLREDNRALIPPTATGAGGRR